jgi:hypothetical protein
MARYVSIVVTMALLAVLFLPVQAAETILPPKFEQPVDDGIAWLVTQQKPDGSWGTPPVEGICSNDQRVEKTAFAVIKMLDRARELGEFPAPEVQKGLNFIFRKVQADGSIWDYYPYNAGLCKESIPPIIPETSAAIMAIASAGTPDMVFEDSSVPPLPAAGKTYQQVVVGAVSYLAWAQKGSGCADPDCPDDAGGWSFARDDYIEAITNQPADQITTGSAALALVFAGTKSGISVDTDTKTRLERWVGNTQDSSGGATLDLLGGSPTVQYTGALLTEQYLLGLRKSGNPTNPVDKAIQYIEAHWTGWDGGSSLARYSLMKGLVLMDVDTLTVGGNPVDWFDVLTTGLLGEKAPEVAYWPPGTFTDSVIPTSLALLTLEGKIGTMEDGNTPPVAADQEVNTLEDTGVGITLSASDADGDVLTYEALTPPAHGSLSGSPPDLIYTPVLHYSGRDSFTFRANDGLADSNIATVSITVFHPSPSLSCLWPPNHAFEDITVGIPADPSASIVIAGVTSDEPTGAITGAGGKNHGPDARIIDADTVALLRAERSGNENGRVYAISFTVTFGDGTTGSGTVRVNVPHDQRSGCFAIDDGQVYNALV